MALVPLLFSNWWEDLDRPHRLFDQDFGLGLYQDQLLPPQMLEYLARSSHGRDRNPCLYYRPWNEFFRKSDNGTSTVNADKNKFQVTLDVQQFKPDEINVKVVDKFVVVEAKHNDKKDEHGWISRQFVRRYMIPEQCDLDQISSSLSSDGVLTITVPRKNIFKQNNERCIKIEHTGQPAIYDQNYDKKSVKDSSNEEKPKK